jgi:hypothetical protein
MCSRSAARLKLFSSATARKYLNCFKSMDMACGDSSKSTARIWIWIWQARQRLEHHPTAQTWGQTRWV